MKCLALGLACAALASSFCATAAPSLDHLARDVQRAQAIRDVKNLQYTYAQYAQYGLWEEMSYLFAKAGVLDTGTEQLKGPEAIAAFLTNRYGKGHQGLEPGAVNTEIIATPVVNLSVDGASAKGRWNAMMLLADAKGHASIEGGIFENDYVREGGVWKIAALHFHPLYAGPYETGWTNIDGKDLPIVPFHFDGDSAGVPIPTPVGPPPRSKASLVSLEERIRVMNDEDKVRNLQAAYNYYVDRKMWDDVVDLFAKDGVVEIGGIGVYDGPAGARRAMQRMGVAGLTHGQLNDHLLFDNVAEILPGGHEARMRGFELGLVGEADKGEAHWEVNVFDNRFVKEDGIWKVREMRLFPVFRSDYRTGWGTNQTEPVPTGPLAPDHPVPSADQGATPDLIPSFHAPNPVTGHEVKLPPGKKPVATADLTAPTPGATSPTPASEDGPCPPSPRHVCPTASPARIAQDARRLAVSTAYDGAENINSAYGNYADDFQWTDMSKLFGKHGAKEVPFAGYYSGADRITHALQLEYGDAKVEGRPAIAFHWLIQPMTTVAPDGRSARTRTYLFHPDTAKAPGSASLFGAMYPDNQAVLEDGVWRLWNLSLDEPYFSMPAGWRGGWSSKAPEHAEPRRPPVSSTQSVHYFGAQLVAKFPPDVPIKVLGVREEHYRGGTGEPWEWPQILPMWWNYKNPVSGRTPENFLPDCVPCDYAPDQSMTRHGYVLPPSGPEPN